MANLARTDIGFQGGQVLTLRATDQAHEQLLNALQDEGAGRWHDLESDDARITVDLAQVVYVRREGGGQKIGF
jgi:hypothetical protein